MSTEKSVCWKQATLSCILYGSLCQVSGVVVIVFTPQKQGV